MISDLKYWEIEISNKEIKMNKEIAEELKVLKGLTLEIGDRISNILEKLAKSGIDKVNDEVKKGEAYPFSKWVEEQLDRISKIGEEVEVVDVVDEVKNSIPNWMQNLGKGKVKNMSSDSNFSICSNGANSYLVENPSVEWVREKILDAGVKFGNVWFYKREDGSLRKMCFKLHCANPKHSKKPNSFDANYSQRKDSQNITVYDVNKVNKDALTGKVTRGAYRSIPLDRVVRIVSDGTIYLINRTDFDIYKNFNEYQEDCVRLSKPLVITKPKTVVRVSKR